MRRLVPLVLISSLAAAPALAAQDRYGPSPLRGTEDASIAPAPLLTWASREATLRGRAVQAAPVPSYAPRPAQRLQPQPMAAVAAPAYLPGPPLPSSAPAGDPQRVARLYGGPAAQPAYGGQTAHRYSVVREFGEQPDRIAMPDASVLAFGPEVGAAYAASNAKAGDDPGTLSPADQDQLDQANQDDDRREARQKARDKAAAKN